MSYDEVPAFILGVSPSLVMELEPMLSAWQRPLVAVHDAARLDDALTNAQAGDIALIELKLGATTALDVLERHPGIATATLLLAPSIGPNELNRARRLGVRRVIGLPILPEELDEALRYVWEASDAVDGMVHGLSLLELLQAYHHARRTLLMVISGIPAGRLALVDGELVDARCGAATGEQALDELLRRGSAIVRTLPLVDAVEPTFGGVPFGMVMIEALARLDGGRPRRRLSTAQLEAVSAATSEDAVTRIGPSVHPADSETPPASAPSLDEEDTAVIAAMERMHPGAYLGRVVHRELCWLTEIPSTPTPLPKLLSVMASEADDAARGRWIAVIVADELASCDVAVGVFGHAPWACFVPIRRRGGRQIFLSALLRIAADIDRGRAAAGGGVERRGLAESGARSAQPDGTFEVACAQLVAACPTVQSCCLATNRGEVLGIHERTPARAPGAAVTLCRRVLTECCNKPGTEVFCGDTTTQTSCVGMFASGFALVCDIARGGALGTARGEVRKHLPQLERALAASPR